MYLRNTSGSFGLYAKHRDPATGRQVEKCILRMGPYPSPEEALAGYSGRIKHLRKLVRDINRDRYHRHGWAARHERTLAQFEIERLLPKLRAVIHYLKTQKRATEPTPVEQPTT